MIPASEHYTALELNKISTFILHWNLYSVDPIKRTPFIKRTQPGPENSVVMIFALITNPYSADTLC